MATFHSAAQQTINSDILSADQVKQIFTPELLKKSGISFPIRRVYHFTDRSGQYYYVLTESTEINAANDTTNQTLQATAFKIANNIPVRQWSFIDTTSCTKIIEGREPSIWFWTKYCKFMDMDGDAQIDPILIYGTEGSNATNDGRIIFVICYKGTRIHIYHQNGTLDFQRNTHVDQTFYNLPTSMQEQIKDIMTTMVNDGNAIFPYGWQKAMAAKKLYFDELHKN